MSRATHRRVLLGILTACAGVVLAALAVPLPEPAAGTEPGDAGTDISLPLTDSAVTVSGRGAFADMELTVNQTQDLTNQAISLSWTGAPPTVSEPTTFHSNFLQVMQCWGEPDDLVPENPGPPPEQCVWGALIPQGGQPTPGFANAYATSRAYTNRVFPNFDPDVGTVDEASGDVYIDFVAVDGTV
ncbi:MAG TPA: hypothetical protein VFK43_16480, partial [Acidimicrobiales bacterium]|nr:hypothetical protein [Acidimicrobiales bacterium]